MFKLIWEVFKVGMLLYFGYWLLVGLLVAGVLLTVEPV